MKETFQIPFYARLALILICLIGLGYLAMLGENILAPLILGLLFAILLLPLADFLERKLHLPRVATSIISVVLMVVVVASVMYFIGSQLSFLIKEWPQLQGQLQLTITNLQHWIDHTFHIRISKQISYISSFTSKVIAASSTMIGAALLSFSSLLFFFIFTLLYTFFLLFHRKRLVEFLIASFDKKHSEVVLAVINQIQYMIKKYIIGLFIEMVVVALISGLLFWIIGSKFVLLLALITGIFNVIPYIGIFTALLLSTLITFATATPIMALLMALSVLAVHLLDSNILMPVILGSKVRINALVIIIGVIVGEMLWGIAGMFVAIPIIAIMKIICDNVESLYPWAILLGDEETVPKVKKTILSRIYTKGTRFTKKI